MLKRKMLRDITKNLVSYIACIAIIAIGLMTYVSMSNIKDILYDSKENFYNNYSFSDVFADVASMPLSKVAELDRIEGIERVDGKLVKDVRVLFPNRDDNVYLRLVSVDTNNTNRLNDIWIMDGTPLEEGEKSIIIGSKFFDLNNLKIGEDINVVINGNKTSLNIRGKGQSPEYVYALQNPADFLASSENFTAAFIPQDVMDSLFGTNNMVNSISFKLEKGYEFNDVKDKIENKLSEYTLKSLIEKKDQISNFMLSNELLQLKNTAESMPILFLMISTVILWIMLKRMVEHQRTQIGMLKACGYTTYEILMHYISYSVFIGVVGGVVGGVLGYMVSGYMADMYNDFFTLPDFENAFSFKYFFSGIFLAVFFGVIAGYMGAKGVIKLEPAAAMHPPAPVSSKKVFLERIKIFWNSLTVQGRMAIRNIFRSKGRSIFTCIGVGFAFSLMASLFSFLDMFDVMVLDQFKYVQTYDMKIAYSVPLNKDSTIDELINKEGVLLAEPLLEIPVKLTNGHLNKNTVIIGIQDDSKLYNVVDKKNNAVALKKGGFVLAEPLANKLNLKVGDIVTLESPMSTKDEVKVILTDIVPQYVGTNGYMLIDDLAKTIGQNNITTSSILKVDAGKESYIKELFSDGYYVSTIEETEQMKKKYTEMLDQFFFMLWLMAGMAILVAFAIVYNSSIISLSERERELASLRVLGMTVNEVIEVISFEQNFIGFFGILLGIPLTYSFYYSISQSMNTDLYAIPIIINIEMFIYAFIGTVVSMMLAYLNIRKKVNKLQMVEVLKERE